MMIYLCLMMTTEIDTNFTRDFSPSFHLASSPILDRFDLYAITWTISSWPPKLPLEQRLLVIRWQWADTFARSLIFPKCILPSLNVLRFLCLRYFKYNYHQFRILWKILSASIHLTVQYRCKHKVRFQKIHRLFARIWFTKVRLVRKRDDKHY